MSRIRTAYRRLDAAVQDSIFAWGVLVLLLGLVLWLGLLAWPGPVR